MIKRLVHGRGAAVTWRHFATVAIATAITLLAAQPAWASWTEQVAPSPATDAGFAGVSCMSTTACLAVGSYTNTNGTFQVAATSNGSAWTESDPGNPPGATNTVLNGVSCVPAWCMAVGDTGASGSSTLVSQMWNGSSWTAKAAPSPTGATSSQFNGVSCTGTGCVAVGSYTTSAGTFPLAEFWNGTTWSVQTTANPPGTNSQLNGVFCTSLTSCEAVGEIQPGTGSLALAEALAGTTWSIQTTPPNSPGINNLDSVSCSSATHCMAVGSGIADSWNGTTWTATSPVKPPHDTSGPPSFGGVACVTATSCTAVGTYEDDSVPTATAEQWNGTAWKAQSIPVSASESSSLGAVTCPVAHACTAVGTFQDTTTSAWKTLAQVYSLDWQDQDAPQLSGVVNSSLSSISCDTKFCYVAGTFTDSNGNVLGFVQDGNASTWSLMQDASLSYSSFSGIWCPPAGGNCVVVGQTSGPKPLAEAWNGTAFVQQPTPLPGGATDGAFNAVSCSSASNCLAVGFYDVSDNEHALAEAWNGSTWQVVDPPAPAGSTYTVLTGVSCTASSCVAVGNYGDSMGNQQPLAEVYTAGSWTATTVPLPAGAANPSLTAVSCPSTSACLAVGQYFNGSVFVPLAAKWNGTTWADQAPPAPSGSSESGLSGVFCRSATSCEAVGAWLDGSSNSSAFGEGLNGQTWGIQAAVPNGSTDTELRGVYCHSATNCTAVGDQSGPSPQQLLVEGLS
jgi:hypothetical protein